MQDICFLKDFDGWNINKKQLENKNDIKLYPKSRQIWFLKLGVNIGFESDGKGEYTRPVLVIQKIGSLFRCIPMTTKEKNNFFHYKLKSVYFGSNIVSLLMLSQARIFDKRRFDEMIGCVSIEEMKIIKKLLKAMYLPEVF